MPSALALIPALLPLLAALPAPQAARDKQLAPPPLTVDGITGVPIDVLDLQATLRFDAKARTAFATATMSFETTGEGFPLFDLRQREIAKAWLDGAPIEPAKMASHAVSRQCGSLRILEVALPAGTRHELKLEYPVGTPDAPQAQGVLWREGGGVLWDTWFSDLNQGRYLESWFPANLLHDQHPMTLTLDLVHAETSHHLITNGVVAERGEHAWTLTFPPTYTSCSHLIVLVPTAEVTVAEHRSKLKGGRELRVEAFVRTEAGHDAAKVAKQTAEIVAKYDAEVGKWVHPAYVPVYVWTGGRSMEYDGGTTTALAALEHEMFHSWYGRGAKPASQNDGWWDEAWNVYVTGGGRRKPDLSEEGPAVTLCSADPYNRITPNDSYGAGAVFFARVAQAIGDDLLRTLMAEFYVTHAPNPATTAELEQLLIAKGGKPDEVRRLFHRYVYGRSGVPEPASSR
jgi:hypothetical protein